MCDQFDGAGLRARAALAVVIFAGAAAASPAFAENRSFGGFGNNTVNTSWGQAGTDLLRFAPDAYTDGFSAMARSWVSGPRQISNAVNAASGNTPNARNLSDMVWQWGQFLDHDLDLTPAGGVEVAMISTDPGDPQFLGTPIAFTRSIYDAGTGIVNARQQPNQISSYLDGSMIYGSDQGRADGLRTMSGGRLRTSAHATGDLLPFNTTGLSNDNGPFGTPANQMFVAGDIRANEQSGLTAMHTLWVREHNRLADQFSSANPGWSDQEVFDAARKVVGAKIQAITYNEWLPTLLGAGAVGAYGGYQSGVDATIATEFSTAAFRIGHTMLSANTLRIGADGATIPEGDLPLRDAFFNPLRITNEGGIDPLLRGLSSQHAQEIDTELVDDVRNFLFGPPGSGGLDLASLNIQRGRDHGLCDYNAMRVAYGLTAATQFSDINPDPNVWMRLASVYSSVNEIDPWVGMLAEPHLVDSSVGALMSAVIIDQFERLRAGDRFFYLNDADLPSLLATINMTVNDLDAMTLGGVITANTDIEYIQSNVFVVPAPGAFGLLAVGGVLGVRRRRRA